MIKNIFISVALIYTINFYSQTKFEKGYFIKNSGEKVECFIKNPDLLYNPKSFSYKLTINDKEKKEVIENVKIFEIYEISKYERFKVKIDRSSELADAISNTRNPEFSEEQLFLKTLIKGKASLYQYREPNFFRFFFSDKNSQVEQLIFKSYYKKDKNTIAKNEQYKQQLLNIFLCDDVTRQKINSLKYSSKSLTKLFINYNKCVNSDVINYNSETPKTHKTIINLNVRPRVNLSSFSLEDIYTSSNSVDFESKTTISLGVELELVMPFNNNKWAFIVEPTYQNFSSKAVTTPESNRVINYSSIELPFGARHYMFLNEKSKLFINGLLIPDFSFNSNIKHLSNYEVESFLNFGFGFGYKYNNKFSLEIRTYSARKLLGNLTNPLANFKSFSAILGYTIF
jgi:hypothetical protein